MRGLRKRLASDHVLPGDLYLFRIAALIIVIQAVIKGAAVIAMAANAALSAFL